jgi:hypothetical protein
MTMRHVSRDGSARSEARNGLALRFAAPYLAVGLGWYVFHNAWLAILVYHAQILWWSRATPSGLTRPRTSRTTLLILPSALAGPALAVILPRIARVDLEGWLAGYHLTGPSLVVMTVYFALVHPVLEQVHWAPLRDRTRFAHAAFAGYHLPVLHSLVQAPWLAVCFAVLWLASWCWQRMLRESGSLLPAIASQAVADLGIVLVAASAYA